MAEVELEPRFPDFAVLLRCVAYTVMDYQWSFRVCLISCFSYSMRAFEEAKELSIGLRRKAYVMSTPFSAWRWREHQKASVSSPRKTKLWQPYSLMPWEASEKKLTSLFTWPSRGAPSPCSCLSLCYVWIHSLRRHGFLSHLPLMGWGKTAPLKVWFISFSGFCGLSLFTKERRKTSPAFFSRRKGLLV